MSKRMLAILGLLAALSLGTPALMADHGKKDKHQQGKKQDRDDDRGWDRRDGYEYRVYGDRDNRPPGWSHDGSTLTSEQLRREELKNNFSNKSNVA